MPRPLDECWNFFRVVPFEQDERKTQCPRVACRGCDEVLRSAQPSKNMIPHLARCPALGDDDRHSWRLRLPTLKRVLASSSTTVCQTPSKVRRISFGSPARKTPTRRAASESEPERRPPSPNDQHLWHQQVASFFYSANIPFKVIENPALRRILLMNTHGLTLPTRNALATTLLTEAAQNETTRVSSRLRGETHVAVVSDGWTNANSEGIIGFSVCSPQSSSVFWNAISAEDNTHTGEYMASRLSKAIIEVEKAAGKNKVCSVVTDNARNMKKMWEIMKVKHPGVICNGCSAHTMNLILQDLFSKNEVFKSTLTISSRIANFFKKRHGLLARFRKLQTSCHRSQSKRRALCQQIPTRWYSSVSCLKSVQHNRAILVECFSDPAIVERFKGPKLDSILPLLGLGRLNDEQVTAFNAFWSDVDLVVRLCDPLVRTMAMFERDCCCFSMIYHEFQKLSVHPLYVEEGYVEPSQHGNHVAKIKAEIRQRIAERWAFLRSDSMLVAYFLDPSKRISDFKPGDLTTAVEKTQELLASLSSDSRRHAYEYEKAVYEFLRLKQSWEADEREQYRQTKKLPMNWWSTRDTMPDLRRLALRVLSIPTSSASIERAWSILGNIHTKKRNRLSVKSVKMLAFIYMNQHSKELTKPPYHGQYSLSDSDHLHDGDDDTDDLEDSEDSEDDDVE